MAGINPNLGKNLKLQNLQLSKTVNVGTQNVNGTGTDDAKKFDHFVGKPRSFENKNEFYVESQFRKPVKGDVVTYNGKAYKVIAVHRIDSTGYICETEEIKNDEQK